MNKLIRDNIPELAKLNGQNLNTKQLNQRDFITHLKQKLIEEAHEVATAHSTVQLTEELADVLEVIHALAVSRQINVRDIETLRTNKRSTHGGYTKRLLLVDSHEESNT